MLASVCYTSIIVNTGVFVQFRIIDRILGFVIWCWMVLAARTIRYEVEGAEHFRALYQQDDGFIISAWHGRIMLLTAALDQVTRQLPARKKPHAIMISQSKDGNAVAYAGVWHKFISVRGSATNRQKKKDKGGLRALIKSAQVIKAGSMFCITPDGPKGPHEVVGEGTLILASRANAAILPYSISAAPCYRLKSWDRFFLPLPFSKGALIFGTPIYVDASAPSSQQLAEIQAVMDSVTARADALMGRS